MAQYEDLQFDQGTDVAVEIHLSNKDGSAKDLTNHSVNAVMKKTYNSDVDNTVVFNAIIASPLEDGVITLSLTNAQTDSLKAGRYIYDVEISFTDSDANTIVERVLEGQIELTPSVTRP